MYQLLAHRTQQEAAEPAASTTSNHDHVSMLAFLEQNRGRLTFNHLAFAGYSRL